MIDFLGKKLIVCIKTYVIKLTGSE